MVEFFGCNSNITFRSSRYHSVLTTYLSACSRVIEIGSPKPILYYYDDKSNRGTNYCWLARSVFGFNEQHKLTITFIIALLIILQTYIIKWKLIILRLLAFDSGSLQQLTVWCGLEFYLVTLWFYIERFSMLWFITVLLASLQHFMRLVVVGKLRLHSHTLKVNSCHLCWDD